MICTAGRLSGPAGLEELTGALVAKVGEATVAVVIAGGASDADVSVSAVLRVLVAVAVAIAAFGRCGQALAVVAGLAPLAAVRTGDAWVLC